METQVADSGATIAKMPLAGSTGTTKCIGYTSAILVGFVSSLILAFKHAHTTRLTSIGIGSRSSAIRAATCAAMARILITSALMSGPALKATIGSASEAYGST